MLVSSTHFFRMTTPLGRNTRSPIIQWWSRTKEIFTSVRLIEQNCPSAHRLYAGASQWPVGKLRRSNPSRKSPRRKLRPNQTAKQRDGHERMNVERMNVGLVPGMARMETFEMAFIATSKKVTLI